MRRIKGYNINCVTCRGFGVVDRGYHHTSECLNCNGTGINWVYTKNGSLAVTRGGKFLGSIRNFEQLYDQETIKNASRI